MFVVKTDTSGDKGWQKIIETSGQPDVGICLAEISDGFICGGYIIAGGSGDEYPYTASGHPTSPSDEWKAFIVKTGAKVNVRWQGAYSPARVGNTACKYIGLTSDDGYIAFNDTDAFWGSVGSNAFWIYENQKRWRYCI